VINDCIWRYQNILEFGEIWVLAALSTKVFWVIGPCSLEDVYRCITNCEQPTTVYGATSQKTVMLILKSGNFILHFVVDVPHRTYTAPATTDHYQSSGLNSLSLFFRSWFDSFNELKVATKSCGWLNYIAVIKSNFHKHRHVSEIQTVLRLSPTYHKNELKVGRTTLLN
jgi:hypothetical protein